MNLIWTLCCRRLESLVDTKRIFTFPSFFRYCLSHFSAQVSFLPQEIWITGVLYAFKPHFVFIIFFVESISKHTLVQLHFKCFWASKTKNIGISFRCHIPQCDNADQKSYTQNWLNFTTPITNDIPEKCTQYQFQGDDDYMQYVNHQCSRQVSFFFAQIDHEVFKNSLVIHILIENFGWDQWDASMNGIVVWQLP